MHETLCDTRKDLHNQWGSIPVMVYIINGKVMVYTISGEIMVYIISFLTSPLKLKMVATESLEFANE
ncbi:hypothetical protein Sjap_001451 [Stephania japonica]|uniref:Uncharacterized protein n=1 Tax=Stephania japonica TaxID=461633 RepID=A0AAP0PV19_9MAGN